MVAALIILMLPAQRKNEARAVALASATFALILSAWVYFSYDKVAAGYQFIEQYSWLPALGVDLHFGVDGIEHSAGVVDRRGDVHRRLDLLGRF